MENKEKQYLENLVSDNFNDVYRIDTELVFTKLKLDPHKLADECESLGYRLVISPSDNVVTMEKQEI